MRSRIITAIAAMLVCTAQVAANDQMVAQLKARGKVVDDLSVSISKAPTDEIAGTLANVTRQTLDDSLRQERPTIVIKATAGHCRVTIETAAWNLWSEAEGGRIIQHGAKIR